MLEINKEFRPLDGIRVVEVSHMVFGPACGMFLGFLGAEVVKVEPAAGDKTRQLTGMGASFFPTFNRGKKSVSLDMATDEGRAAFDALIGSADVLVENFRDGSLDRMGLDPERLRRLNPKLITVACKGFLRGPYEHRSALDEVVQMMSGLAYMTGPKGSPLRVGSSANDIMGGLFGACAVMGALKEREQTGRGREIRVGLFENSLLLVAQHMVQFELLGTEPPPMPDREFSWPVYDIFQTRDGRDLFVGAVTEGQWSLLCGILKLESLLSDPALQSRMDQIEARSRTIPVIRDAVRNFDAGYLERHFEDAGIPYAPVLRPAEMYDDPQATCDGGLPVSKLADGRTFRSPVMPIEVDQSRVVPDLDVPATGADSWEVLSRLGFDRQFIAKASGDSGETE